MFQNSSVLFTFNSSQMNLKKVRSQSVFLGIYLGLMMGSGTVRSHHVQGSTLKETEFNVAKLNQSTTKATENLELNCFVIFNEICMLLSPFSSTLLAKISVGRQPRRDPNILTALGSKLLELQTCIIKTGSEIILANIGLLKISKMQFSISCLNKFKRKFSALIIFLHTSFFQNIFIIF